MPENVENLEFKVKKVPHWTSFKPEEAEEDGIKYLRKHGSDIIYKKTEKGYECMTCGEEVMSGRVAHPIWDGPIPMSGGGECKYEEVPYCPKCEEEPNFHGSGIEVGQKYR